MLRSQSTKRPTSIALALALLAFLVLTSSVVLMAQSSQEDQQKPAQQQAPPEAGGPEGDVGPIIVPRKNPDEAPAPPKEERQIPKNPEGMPDFSLRVDVPNVQVPVLVTTKDGTFVPGLGKDNFKVTEDGVPQTITSFKAVSDAPITAVLLVEFANNNPWFQYDAVRASYVFADNIKKDDWIAVITYDMKPFVLTDFTQDKREVYGAINQLRIPGFRETNMFDALYDTLDRIDRIQGRKYIVLVGTGRDTFSKLNYDKILKKIQQTQNVGIFTVSTGEALRTAIEARYGSSSEYGMMNLDYLQADNEMNTFAKMTGGRWYKPRFEAELPEIFHDIATQIRNQYVLTYKPTNSKQDGTYRKLKVELQGPEGGPLTVKDQKGKVQKTVVIARDGYTAKHEVE